MQEQAYMTRKEADFNEWFDSEYYHLLYRHRDEEEAGRFIDNLFRLMEVRSGDRVLDIACGKGRHAVHLSRRGFDVTGIDLSRESIKEANACSGDKLRFFVHDMRSVFQQDMFHYALNLFTSFGYFDTEEEDVQVLNAAKEALLPGGKLVIDFMNSGKVLNTLVPEEYVEQEGVGFYIRRWLEKGFIIKEIEVDDNGSRYYFRERVKAIRKDDFMKYFDKAGFRVQYVFGDYNLNAFDPEQSDRMIFVVSND